MHPKGRAILLEYDKVWLHIRKVFIFYDNMWRVRDILVGSLPLPLEDDPAIYTRLPGILCSLEERRACLPRVAGARLYSCWSRCSIPPIEAHSRYIRPNCNLGGVMACLSQEGIPLLSKEPSSGWMCRRFDERGASKWVSPLKILSNELLQGLLFDYRSWMTEGCL